MKQKYKKKWIFILVVFMLVITAIRLVWMNFLTTIEYTEKPSVENGVLDLRGWDFSSNQTLSLKGEWDFYPSAFVSPEKDINILDDDKRPLTVPKTWDEAFADQGDNPFHYGTYRLRILLDEHQKALGLRINEIRSASTIYVNGRKIASYGKPATKIENYQAGDLPYTIEIEPIQNEIDLVIHVATYTYTGAAGITEPIRFGTMDAIKFRTNLSMGLQVLLCVVLLLHSIYAVLFFFLGVRNKGLLYFFVLILFASLSVLVSDDKLLLVWIDLPYEWSKKVIYFSYIGVAMLIPITISQLFPSKINQLALRGFQYFCLFYALLVLVVPYSHIESLLRLLLVVVIPLSVIISVNILRKKIKNTEDLFFLLIGCITIGVNFLWTVMINKTQYVEWMHYPFDLIIVILAFSSYWFRRYFRTNMKTKQLAEKLQFENKRKDEFLVNTSHELRNPLHAIINLTNSLLEDSNESVLSDQRRRLETMENIGKRMSLMLNDLIDITRLKENAIQLKLTAVALPSIIAGVVDMIRFMLESKHVQLQVDIPDDLPTVHADENRLVQIIFNLVHNAVKYTDEGTIKIRANCQNRTVYIHVEDTGVGIEEEALNRIFQPYEQAHHDAARDSDGIGLGLSICKQLVELHGGTLSVHSTLHKGSVFTFTVPIYQEREGVSTTGTLPIINNIIAANGTDPSRTASHQISKKTKILAVDDDSVNLQVLTYLLERENYEIFTVTSAMEGIAQLEKQRYDLVISDVMMPQVSGYELTRLIRERYSISELPILLLTARTRNEDILTGFQSGANDYVKKPVDSTELKARVRALIELKLSIEERVRMEGAWLQSQIQPHFLYNTLNSIAALGEIDLPKMQALLEEFSNYLQLSFDFKNSDPMVPLEHELSLVRSYLYIEQERFRDRIKVCWEIEPNINVFLPPLSIQPLVENAVRHGILQRKEGGTICIQIKAFSDYISISVSDNGRGMLEQEIEQLYEIEEHSKERAGIGLRNIDRRLIQLYGKGLTIKSKLEHGTTVSFHIPL